MHSETSNNILKPKTARYLTDVGFYTAILFFIIGFNFSDVMVGNWYQQFLPSIGSRTIQDIFFLDSLTGWAVTNATNQSTDTTIVLKTTNSGDSWVIQYRKIQTGGGFSGYFKVYFLNQNTGYTCDVNGIRKTTDGGSNWQSMNAPSNAYLDMSILNTDTVWIVTPDSFAGGVFRTTNGGVNWDQQLFLGSQNPTNIYFYNKDTGFVAQNVLYKTTNTGVNWVQIPAGGGFSDMYFVNSLTGWKCSGAMKKTTDGGLNWVTQVLPNGGNFLFSQITAFKNLNKDTIWGVGSTFITGVGNRGVILRTVNGGDNWLFQVPDSNINIFQYQYIDFVKPRIGWAYSGLTGIHTTNGGDTTFLVGLQQISSLVPKEFILFQNYPNPFNPATNIKYSVKRERSNVKLIIYDVQGKLITELVNQKQNAGTYLIDFDGSKYASGIYFYKLTVLTGKEVYTDTKKMVLIK